MACRGCYAGPTTNRGPDGWARGRRRRAYPGNQKLKAWMDFSLVSDPWLNGCLTALHASSDLGLWSLWPQRHGNNHAAINFGQRQQELLVQTLAGIARRLMNRAPS